MTWMMGSKMPWMGQREHRYHPMSCHGHGTDLHLDDGKMASLPWFAIEGLEERRNGRHCAAMRSRPGEPEGSV